MRKVMILRTSIRKARKDYNCDGCNKILKEFSMPGFADYYGLSFSDKRKLVTARKENYKILKETKYLEEVGLYDGFYHIRCRPEIYDILANCNYYND
jgi:lysine/ornithine N-monooxygenase